jgi:drug/metabolite transporter (DMT)-like permease
VPGISTPLQRQRAWAAWVAVCIVWGTTYLAIKLALTTIPPFLIGGLRYAAAGAALTLARRAAGEPLPPRRTWSGFALLGLLMFGVGNGGVVWAETWISSGLAAVIIATSPFWMVGVEALVPGGERLRPLQVVGLVLGFAGILLLVGPAVLEGGPTAARLVAGVVSLQLACAGWAAGSSYGKRHAPRTTPMMSAGLQMLAGGLIMLAAGTLIGDWPRLRFDATSLAALAYLTVAGSVAGFGAYMYALAHLPVSVVSLYAYVNPIIAVALGTLLLAEPFDRRMAIGIGVTLAGLAVVSVGKRSAAK